MFIANGKRWYGRDGEQKASGYFLLGGLPKTRDAEWLAAEAVVKARCVLLARADNRGAGGESADLYWGDYRTDEEKAAGYGEFVYHAPFSKLRCCVRFVRMRQCGHWMMGSAMHLAGPKPKLTVSGSYGSDGLPMSWDRELWEKCMPLPPELCKAWAKGGGWNRSGSEGPSIHEWAVANIKLLKNAGKP